MSLPAGRRADLADDLDAELGAQVARRTGQQLVADHDLDDAARFAQVDERDAAVVATVRDPAGERDGLAGVLRAERAGLMGADHWSSLFLIWWVTSSSGRALCSPLRRSLHCTTPDSRSRSPSTSAYAPPERSAAFIAPFRPRAP